MENFIAFVVITGVVSILAYLKIPAFREFIDSKIGKAFNRSTSAPIEEVNTQVFPPVTLAPIDIPTRPEGHFIEPAPVAEPTFVVKPVEPPVKDEFPPNGKVDPSKVQVDPWPVSWDLVPCRKRVFLKAGQTYRCNFQWDASKLAHRIHFTPMPGDRGNARLDCYIDTMSGQFGNSKPWSDRLLVVDSKIPTGAAALVVTSNQNAIYYIDFY